VKRAIHLRGAVDQIEHKFLLYHSDPCVLSASAEDQTQSSQRSQRNLGFAWFASFALY
jgi:hypothetical protein